MMAFSIQQTQRRLQIVGVAGIVLAAGSSFLIVEPILGGGSAGGALAMYNVSFIEVAGAGAGASGSASFLSSAQATVPVDQANLTQLIFHISYTDNSFSPLFNPAVTVTILGPEGSGGGSGSVPPGQTADIQVTINNLVPANQTLEATSTEEALSKATGDSANATIGMGDWMVTVDVGAPLAGRIRPSGTISYTIALDMTYFEGTAERL
jgi:hypothetical protein